jgi:pimeloyl-ACP methyl ester carboxylesterase
MKKLPLARLLLLAGLASILLAPLYSLANTAQNESPPFPPAGKLVDIGGWRLHINCAGEAKASRPTVVLEAGLGDFSVEWSLVQPSVAKFARVCSYDRAGDGWSDWGPHPRTMHQIVYELHSLLERAGVKPPIVFVGHSYGCWLARVYASEYRSDLVGMVLIDGGADDPLRMLPDGKVVHSSDLASGRTVPPVKVSNPLRVGEIPAGALSQIKAELPEAVAHANDAPRNKLPSDAQHMRTWALGQVGHVVAAVNPFESEELAGLRAERATNPQPLGDMPLIVVTRGLSEDRGPDSKAREEEHRRDETAVAALSRKGKLVVAAHSGHHIQLDEPEFVINAIREVLDATKK